jgi:hypothetical protein
MDKFPSYTESVASTRGHLAELIAVTIAISLGVNFLASGLVAELGGFSWLTATIGAVLIILGCAYFTLRAAASRITRKVSLYGILSTGPRENELLPIERYRSQRKWRIICGG